MARVIRQQRRALRDLVGAFRRQPHVTERVQGDQLWRRQELTIEIRRRFVGMASVDQRLLWPEVGRRCEDGDRAAKEGASRRQRAEEHLAKLQWFGDRDPALNEVADEAMSAIGDYLELADRHVAGVARAASARWLGRFARELTRDTWMRPTRPHPDLPRLPGLLGGLTAVIGAVDHLVDRTAFGPTGA